LLSKVVGDLPQMRTELAPAIHEVALMIGNLVAHVGDGGKRLFARQPILPKCAQES